MSQNPEHSSPDLLANETFSQFMLLSSLHPGQQQAVVQAVIGTLHVISPSNLNILLNKKIANFVNISTNLSNINMFSDVYVLRHGVIPPLAAVGDTGLTTSRQ